uniref:Endonuclease/exonuclease/phosphatase domain-containing protein n=1 Tax=Amphiprion ocellaris TaxID=80972 RepID=A0AAQ5WX91_AMPOC
MLYTSLSNTHTWNVHGICSQTKRVKIMDNVSKLKADILVLQETHLLQSEEKSLTDSNYSIIFSSCYNSRQRGVSILVHKRVPFTLKSIVLVRMDLSLLPEGRGVNSLCPG